MILKLKVSSDVDDVTVGDRLFHTPVDLLEQQLREVHCHQSDSNVSHRFHGNDMIAVESVY